MLVDICDRDTPFNGLQLESGSDQEVLGDAVTIQNLNGGQTALEVEKALLGGAIVDQNYNSSWEKGESSL